MGEELVAIFEGDVDGTGLRLIARSRDPGLVRRVRSLFAEQSREQAGDLERGSAGRHLRQVRDPEPGRD